VEVRRAMNVGVARGCVAGEAQLTNRIKPSRKAGSVLVFIFISSFYYISRQKENARWLILAFQRHLFQSSFPKHDDDHMLVQ
jgi:hypothetical protein